MTFADLQTVWWFACRSQLVEGEKQVSELQQQRDAAQADLEQGTPELLNRQDSRSSLQQQLQQAAEQLSASQQAESEVSHCCCCLHWI